METHFSFASISSLSLFQFEDQSLTASFPASFFPYTSESIILNPSPLSLVKNKNPANHLSGRTVQSSRETSVFQCPSSLPDACFADVHFLLHPQIRDIML